MTCGTSRRPRFALQMGVVLQDGFVFRSTIRENIRMGRPTATEEAIAGAARDAGMLEFIQAQPLGFDTPVGTDSLSLSGEMTQRLAIARAVLRKPAIPMLLDEISSAARSRRGSVRQPALSMNYRRPRR